MKSFQKIPEVVSGIRLAEDEGWFSVILPRGCTNYITNPKVANDLTGYTGDNATISRTSSEQRRGLFSIKVIPDPVTDAACYYGTVSTTADTVYAFSCDFKGKQGVLYSIYVASTAGARVSEKVEFYGTGYWQRVSVVYPETSTTTRRLYVSRVSPAANVSPFYLDGLQFEESDYGTTYIDGDLKGFVVNQTAYFWNGAPDASTSTRIAGTRHGGYHVNFDDYEIQIIGVVGLRMPEYNTISSDLATGGSVFQNSILKKRTFTLVCTTVGDNYSDIDYNLRQLENALDPKLTGIAQELQLVFHRKDSNGNESRMLFIPCVYKSGLEGAITNPAQEAFTLTFEQPIPYMYEDGNQAQLMRISDTIYDPCAIVTRDMITGEWSTPSTGASTGGSSVNFFEASDGKIYIYGSFSQIAGVSASNIIVFDPVLGTFTALGSGCNAAVYDIVEDTATKILYVMGLFTTAGGITVNYIANYDPSTGTWAAMTGGGASGGTLTRVICGDIDRVNRRLFVAGDFQAIGGVTSNRMAYFDIDTTTWVATGGISTGPQDDVYDLVVGDDLKVYVCGKWTAIGVVSAPGTGRWNGGTSWSTIGTGLDSPSGFYSRALVKASDGTIYIGRANGAVVVFAYWSGSAWVDLTPTGKFTDIWYMNLDQYTGEILISNAFPTSLEQYWVYDGNDFRQIDADLHYSSIGTRMMRTASKRFYPCSATRSVSASTVETVENISGGIIEPTLVVYGPGTLQRIHNSTSGLGIDMEYEFLSGEVSEIKLGTNITADPAVRTTMAAGSTPFFLSAGENIVNLFMRTPFTEYNDTPTPQVDSYEMITGFDETNTDDWTIYISIIADGGGYYHLEIYKDAARGSGDLVGHTGTYNAAGEQAITADNSSGLGGRIYITNTAGGAVSNIYVELGRIYMMWTNTFNSLSKALL